MDSFYVSALKSIIDTTPPWAEEFWISEVDAWGALASALCWVEEDAWCL